ncbi:S-layer homology domain-containing protein [Pseudoflavonifractor phocaeensis]|uniref:S-layer homology domain-containing protein n=1 Tax=Pseudoflavonifractor phocaeensis TaxID=1870988 RepID=UPI001F249BAE|nr:S-layer homology domain-containing protein [Pseudoflavonifractor phocaeensis]MCF2662021.1 S-layer homology domain-containing protein [Pseudoflavonifractor phocaeensis]
MKHKQTLRRGLGILLSLVLCLSLLPAVTLTAAAADEHTHCICGSKVAECGDKEDSIWTAWEQSDSLPDTAGYYYLTKDVTLTETWKPKNNTYLCLNGKTITANFEGSVITISSWKDFYLTDCADAANPGVVTHGMKDDETKYTGCGVEIESNEYAGTFHMYGGSISGNIITGESNQQGAGVMVGYQGSFRMYGGVICDNKAVCTADSGSAQGGGVYSAYKFYMYGGKITGNDVSASNPQGGGVFVSGPASMGGTPVIDGNTATVPGQPSKPNNYLVSDYSGQDSGLNIRLSLKDGAHIGVTRDSDSEADFARGNGYTINATDASKFVPDDENYIVLMGDYLYGSLKLLERSAANVASATIGSETTEYMDLQEALQAVIDSSEKTGTVKLLKDVMLANSITLEQGVDLTLDMNGHNLIAKKVNADSFITIDQSKLNITGKGTIETSSTYSTKVNNTIHVKDGSVCTVGKDVSISNTYARVLYMSGNSECTVSGTLEGRTVAIEIRAGKLTIDEPAELNAFGEYDAPTENGVGDSNIELGCIALAVSPLENDLPITVDIKGGTFIADNIFMEEVGMSLYEVDLYHSENPSENVSINISGGEFKHPVQSLNDKLTLSGGSFAKLTASETLSALLAKDYGFKSIDGNNIILTEGQKEVENVTVDKLYTVSFDANGGSSSMDAVKVVSGSYTLPECGFDAPQGLQFVGWATSANDEVISGATITVTQDTTLYAIWGINYGVTVNGVKVTSLNKDNVLGNDKVQYDPATKTLYAKNLYAADLTVAGNGSTIVDISSTSSAPAVGTLTVTGAKDATVTANSGTMATSSNANITCSGNVTITGAVTGALTVTGAEDVTITAGSCSQLIAGKTDISCSGNVTITCESGTAVTGALTVTGAKDITVTANSSNPTITDTADITCSGDVIISNSTGKAVYSSLTYQRAGDHGYTVKTGISLDELADYEVKKAGQVFTATLDASAVKISVGHTADEWKSSSTQHWQVCTVCGAELNRADHTFSGRTCTVCGYIKPSSGSSSGSSSPSYSVTVDKTVNGTVTVSPKSAAKGDTVTLTVTPDKGHTLETLTVTDASGKEVKLTEKNGKYNFTMPAGKVTVEATFMEDNSMLNFFVDVPADAYYYDAVLWAAENGITGGVDDTHFAPDAPCTRAQIVTFLWRAAGSPEPESVSSFADVPADSYYAKAVAWAVEQGITTGTGDGKFSPNAPCTRAQSVTFLWRAQKSPSSDSVNPFADVAADAYYNNAVLWAAENGITGGTSATTFSPNNDCTRAQIVTFLYRCLG